MKVVFAPREYGQHLAPSGLSALFHDLRLSVLIFDYRGYGRKVKARQRKMGHILMQNQHGEYLVRKIYALKRLYCSDALWGSAVAKSLQTQSSRIIIIDQGLSPFPLSDNKKAPVPSDKINQSLQYSTIDKVDKINMPALSTARRMRSIYGTALRF